jgi:alpha-tubulin suppressor-like RCC1 family protein
LGLGDFNSRNLPTMLQNLFNIIQISAGLHYSLVLNYKGQVYSFGDNAVNKNIIIVWSIGIRGHYY